MIVNKDMKFSLRRRWWVDNIKIDLRYIGWDGVNWIDLTQDRDQWRALVNTMLNLQVSVSRRLPTAAAWVQIRVWSYEIL
jgi:hypothetical protein